MSLFRKKHTDIPRRRLANDGAEKSAATSDIFRRNRTLTGTTSNYLDSTNAKSDLKSPRVHSHGLAIQRRKVMSVLIVVLISAVSVWVLVSNLTATVEVSVSDTSISKPVDKSRYVKAIQGYLDTNPLNRLSFFLDQSAMNVYVLSKLPEVAKISQGNMVGIGTTNFNISMRTPVAGWQINGRQYYVDPEGIAFEQNYFSSTVVQIIDNSGVSLKTDTSTPIASRRFLGFVGRVVSLAKADGYTVTQAALPANTTRELEVRLKESGYLVRLSIDRPAGEQVEDMVAAVKYFTARGQIPEYIDVRVSGKAFYR